MANLSPEALAKIAAALPDDVNPDEFGTQYQALQAAQADADKLRQLDEWFRNDYQPWFQTYGGDFAEFQRYKQHNNSLPESTTPTTTTTTTSPTSRTSDSIDYESPDALRDAVSYLNTRLDSVQQAADDRVRLVEAQVESRSQEMQRLLALQEQAYGLLNEATWDRIEPGWRPPVDIPKLVTYAQQQNIPDLRRAYQSYSQTDREKDIERRAYERGKEEAIRASAAQSITTEMSGGGAPFKHAQPPDRKSGNAGRQDILEQIHARWAQRRAQ